MFGVYHIRTIVDGFGMTRGNRSYRIGSQYRRFWSLIDEGRRNRVSFTKSITRGRLSLPGGILWLPTIRNFCLCDQVVSLDSSWPGISRTLKLTHLLLEAVTRKGPNTRSRRRLKWSEGKWIKHIRTFGQGDPELNQGGFRRPHKSTSGL